MSDSTADVASTRPVKDFFVSVLTRDINLEDAILDLVDNSLDGALRFAAGGNVNYSKHYVDIRLTNELFRIKDNCGGISLEIAKKYAFTMGRDRSYTFDLKKETIGMFCVGMKRAIFKMGKAAVVRTHCKDNEFEVPIDLDWMLDEVWKPLPIDDTKECNRLEEPGTVIEVRYLHDGVARRFMNEGFLNQLHALMERHFTTFLKKGLKISINGTSVNPIPVEVLVSKDKEAPAPYVFQKVIQGVTVSIAVGYNASGKSSSGNNGLDGLNFESDRLSAVAGWTVFCNDRAVIFGDKTRLTGWGDGIPLYHDQFSIITGIIEFRSEDATQLPITTTKRSLDTSSSIWLDAYIHMKKGMKIWTMYTNAWKNYPRSSQTKYWNKTESCSLRDAIDTVFLRPDVTGGVDDFEFNPKTNKLLPRPPSKELLSRVIRFSRPKKEIQNVSMFLFQSSDEHPKIVGEKCFEMVLDNAQKKGEIEDE